MTTKPRSTRSSSSKGKDDGAPPLVPVGPDVEPPIPNAVGYEIAKPINLSQILAEITEVTGTEVVNACLLGPDDHDHPIGPDNKTTLWLAPPSFNQGKLAQVVARHNPNPDWGIPAYINHFNEVLGKLQADPQASLTDSDRDALLRGLAMQYATLLELRGQQ